MTMTTPPPPTIPELIASLGPPRNYAEQIIIEDIRDLATQAAATPNRPDLYHACWMRAHGLCRAIEAFRAHGDHPPLTSYRPAE